MANRGNTKAEAEQRIKAMHGARRVQCMEKELRSGRSVPFVRNDIFLSQIMGIFLHYAVWHEKTGLHMLKSP